MDALLANYKESIKSIKGNIFEVFSIFYDSDLSLIQLWLENKFKNKTVKDNTTSQVYRQQGNKYFSKKELTESIEYYNKSLCFATYCSEEYNLALANRSAVFLEMGDFRSCLKDIELCFKPDCPNKLKLKLYVRKAECYCKLNETQKYEETLSKAEACLESVATSEKEKFLSKLKGIKHQLKDGLTFDSVHTVLYEIPGFPEGENQQLASASNKITMHLNKEKGRRIIAKSNIKRGEILFIEKSFIFVPIFQADKKINKSKCYNCLKNIKNYIPCKSCTICVYCDENCREINWSKYHKWECCGMQANVWFDLGIAFPAFRALLEGAKIGFRTSNCSFVDDLKQFGNKENNYPFFNRLLSHIYKNKNMAPYVVMAAIVTNYLEKYTEFFPWLFGQQNCPKDDYKHLVRYVGGLIAKHIGQLACNSSTIEHWSCTSEDVMIPDVLTTTACGIFPSVSIMNHSCMPNVTNYFICDTIVIKAANDIQENEEIFNCYGIDYRIMLKEERQYACKKLYHFTCECVICSDSSRELDKFDDFLCPQCEERLPENVNSVLTCCAQCGKKCDLTVLRNMNNSIQNYSKSSPIDVEFLRKNLETKKTILFKYHRDFEEIYNDLYTHCIQCGDADGIYEYCQLWLDHVKVRQGPSCRKIGIKLYEAAVAILHCLQNHCPQHNTSLKDFLHKVELMIKEAKIILNLYYPKYFIDRLTENIQ